MSRVLNVHAAYNGLPASTADWKPEHYNTFLTRLRDGTNFFIDKVIYGTKEKVGNYATYFSSGANFPDSVLPIMEKYRSLLHTDDAWEQAFRMVDMTNIPREGMRVTTVGAGITFEAVPEGNKAKLYSASGTDFFVKVDTYGGGMQWSRRLIDDQEYWTIEDNTAFFLNSAARSRSLAAYGMIESISASRNLAWQNPTPANLPNTDANYVAIRDFNTINQAIINMLVENKDKGYGISESMTFLILAPIQLKPRLDRAMGILNGQISGTGFDGVRFNVRVLYTMNLTVTDKYYVCIPGIKNYFIDRQRLQIFTRFEETSYSDLAVGWMRYGGMIADQELWTRCFTA
jgi:hypothetical protein